MPPLTRSAQQDREADTVRSHPTRSGYWCPSKAATIGHLEAVSLRLSDPKLTPEKRAVLDEDQDALLLALAGMLRLEATATVDTA